MERYERTLRSLYALDGACKPLYEWARSARSPHLPEKISWHYLQRVQGETVARASRVVVPAISAIGGLLAGCIGMYFALSMSWTHIVARSRPVTGDDFDVVATLSIIAGVIVGGFAMVLSAKRYRIPQTRNFRPDLVRRSKRPALTL
jgi:hypothetical protein